MSGAGWHRGPMLAWRVTGTDPEPREARMVAAGLVWIEPGKPAPLIRRHLIDPEEEIPAPVTAACGITTEQVRAHGRPPEPVLEEIATAVADALAAGWPLVGAGVVFELTLLDRELRRHQLRTVEERLGRPIGPVIDADVLDHYVGADQFAHRSTCSASQVLPGLCSRWGVRLERGQDTAGQALAAARVAWMIAHRHPEIAAMPLAALHELQTREHAAYQTGRREYLDWLGQPHDGCETGWPLLIYRPAPIF
ncbi:hypothetical protein ACFOWE_31285 [Planomonospora corallina]|uniref:Exonuclease n=1 Tax=Planomonospora corallina TaxID=1806052 RepID=A0ABV8IFC1_9ACTN